MIDTLMTSGVGLASGFVFKMLKEYMNYKHQQQLALMQMRDSVEKSMEAASKRPGTLYARKLLVWSLVFSVIVIPSCVILFTAKGVSYPVETVTNYVFGLWSSTSTEWVVIKEYPFVPEVLQAFNLIVCFNIGQGPAKGR